MNKHSARLRAAFRGRKQVKKPATDFLLIDVSNSSTKLAFASHSRIGRTSKIATSILTADRITKILRGHDSATLVVSSVVPKKTGEIRRAAAIRKVIWLSALSRVNVRIGASVGYGKLIERKLPEVDAVHENRTLEGLRLAGCMNSGGAAPANVCTQRCRGKSTAAIAGRGARRCVDLVSGCENSCSKW